MINIAVFASGRGSNFQAVHRKLSQMPNPPAQIALCVSNNPKPGAFEYAEANSIPTCRISPKMFPNDEEKYDRELQALLSSYRIDLIVLAGYMRMLPPGVVALYRGRILNVHPALLPDFGGQGMYGMNVHRAVIEAGREESGVTVHLVDEEYDTGAIVAQERVPVLADDTAESLAERVLHLEHDFYPRVILKAAQRLSEGKEIV
ncbi:MAG: phosphoribosylglycinamide formyltransferase [Candidatus Kapaibacterium sp.]